MMKWSFAFLIWLLKTCVSSLDTSQIVDWRCEEDAITVTLSTRDPFVGTLMAKRRPKKCATIGSGNTTTELIIPLDDLERCNVTFDDVSNNFSVTVEVHSHPVLVLDNDKAVVVTCSLRVFQETTTEFDEDVSTSFHLTLSEENYSKAVKEAVFGKSYSIEVSNTYKEDFRPFEVVECRANGADNLSVALSDSRGCPTVPFMTPFQLTTIEQLPNKREYRSKAQIPSMFRFPNGETVNIQCVIRLCESGDQCQFPCLTAKDSPITPDTVRALLNDVATFEEGEGDGYLATASLKIVDPRDEPTVATAAEARSSTSFVPCKSTDDEVILYAACIGLFMAFLMGCCCNSLFCMMMSKRRKKKTEETIRDHENKPDYWIHETTGKPAFESPKYFDARRLSGTSYASVKKTRLSKMPSEYGIPQAPSAQQSQLSDYGSSDGREYASSRDFGATSSTFMSHSLTMETDLDSPGSNQKSSYH